LHFGAPLERLAPVGKRLMSDQHGELFERVPGAVIGSKGELLIADERSVDGWIASPLGMPIFVRRRR
jgi:hypothetical protein